MSLFNNPFRNGYYDEKGHWQRTKHCFVYCGVQRCDCGPPHGRYQLSQDEVEQRKKEKE